MLARMTVADLSPHQFYGLIMLAFLMCIAGILAARAYENLPDWRPKLIFWVGFIGLYGIPAWFGLSALAP